MFQAHWGPLKVSWAVSDRLFTGAIPLLFDAGAFACCVSTLGRFVPL